MGLISDKLVNIGGSVILGETIEWLGAEHLLIKKAVSKIKEKIMNSLNSQVNFAKSKNIDLLGNNPGFQNIEAGLSTIEEKSLGNVAKAGSSKIQDLISWGEQPKKRGLNLMHAPSYAPESLSGFSSAGCQLVLFQQALQ